MMTTRYKNEKKLKKHPVTNMMSVTIKVSMPICRYAKTVSFLILVRIIVYAKERRKIPEISAYRSRSGLASGEAFWLSWIIMVEPSKMDVKMIRKSISSLSLLYNSLSDISETFFINFHAHTRTAKHETMIYKK
jgi:hypothetical protein